METEIISQIQMDLWDVVVELLSEQNKFEFGHQKEVQKLTNLTTTVYIFSLNINILKVEDMYGVSWMENHSVMIIITGITKLNKFIRSSD
jgi:hypothetical protein